MSVMEPEPNHAQSGALERRLLDSAASDAPPAEATARAWARFATLLALSAANSGVASSSRAPNAERRALLKLAAAKYLLLGALGGWALTYLWYGRPHGRSSETPQKVMSNTLPNGQHVVLPPHEASDLRIARAQLSTPSPAERAVPGVQQRLAVPTTRRAPKAPPATAPSDELELEGSSLAAEVSALDAARAASAAGDFAHALDLLERYRRDFQSGVLRADAEVAVIEALYAQGNRTEAARRAAYFLAHSPNDPHSATVKQFIPP